jgi:hypothetical protein
MYQAWVFVVSVAASPGVFSATALASSISCNLEGVVEFLPGISLRSFRVETILGGSLEPEKDVQGA